MTLPSPLCSQTSVVNYIDQRPAAEKSAQLFFVVFEWKDPFIQKVQDVSVRQPVGANAQPQGTRAAPTVPRTSQRVVRVYDACVLYRLGLIDLVSTTAPWPRRWGCLVHHHLLRVPQSA